MISQNLLGRRRDGARTTQAQPGRGKDGRGGGAQARGGGGGRTGRGGRVGDAPVGGVRCWIRGGRAAGQRGNNDGGRGGAGSDAGGVRRGGRGRKNYRRELLGRHKP